MEFIKASEKLPDESPDEKDAEIFALKKELEEKDARIVELVGGLESIKKISDNLVISKDFDEIFNIAKLLINKNKQP